VPPLPSPDHDRHRAPRTCRRPPPARTGANRRGLEDRALTLAVPMVGSPAARLADELVRRVLGELPALGVLGERDRVLATA
jgi:hypothetical protein